MALSVSRLVRVTVTLSPQAAARRSFGILLIPGDSDVISGLQRIRTYTDLNSVGIDFGLTAPEYLAAQKYFSQTPAPQTLMIGRWLRTATGGLNTGGFLTPTEQLISNWTAISSGGFVIPVDGVTKTLSALDFTGVTNLNGVATVINGALTGAVVTWNGQNFEVESNSTGAGGKAFGTISLDTNPSYGVQASGTITLSGQPSNGDTVTIKGTVVTFVTGTPSGNQVQIAGTALLTAAALQTFLQGSADVNLSACVYNTIGLVTTITARVFGTAGNAYGLLKSGANIAVSAATLTAGVAPDTLTINGTALTFVAATPTGNQVLVGPTATATAANLQQFLSASTDANIVQATYVTVATLTTVTAALAGTAGNAFTLTKSSSHITLSGGTLSGGAVPSSVGFATAGAGTDISALLKLTASTSQALVTGYSVESPVQCIAALANKSPAWYWSSFAASVQPTDDQSIAVSDFIEGLDLKRSFGVTITDTGVLSALVTTDLASRMVAGAYRQSLCQYSSSSPYAICSLIGRASTVDFTLDNTTIVLMYKQEPTVVAEDLDGDQADTLEAKRCNVFVAYDNDTTIIQYGVMSCPGVFIDETHGLDWLQNACQTAEYNTLYTSPTKVAQTDAGENKLVNSLDAVFGQAVRNGLIAPGTWTSDFEFGQLKTGDYLKTGYYIYATPMALQSQSDREARKASPIQSAIKLAGGIQTIDVAITVNR